MRKLYKVIAVAFITTLTTLTVPPYVAADEAWFTVSKTGDPEWFGKRSDGHPEWTRSGDEWFHTRSGGSRLYQRTFDWVGPFSEGLAPVRKDGREFHIRIDGNNAYEASYDAVGPFNMGYAAAVQNGNWFHIGVHGARVYEKNFAWVDRVSEIGQAFAREKSGRGILINMNGEEVE